MKRYFVFPLLLSAAISAQTPPPAPSKPASTKPAAAKPAVAKPAGTTPAAAKPAGPRQNTAALMNPRSLTAKAPDTYKVRFKTTKGDIDVQVTRAWAPLGADRFWNLVRNGFYNDAAFFRVLPGFVAQFGLPANPKLSGLWEAARISDDPVTQSNKRGTLSFATAGPNTRTTQIFINYGENTRLDSMGFAPFGVVLENGMAVADQFHSGYGENPNQGAIGREGKAYLDRQFPLLDKIVTIEILEPLPSAAPAKPAVTPAKPAASPAKKSVPPAKP
ncbi:MAG: peptidylprolyl isomerase [Bryobacteraceae bacterium]|nr:peptidylprolyl isomerase [Bryobacteraceae bacterium]